MRPSNAHPTTTWPPTLSPATPVPNAQAENTDTGVVELQQDSATAVRETAVTNNTEHPVEAPVQETVPIVVAVHTDRSLQDVQGLIWPTHTLVQIVTLENTEAVNKQEDVLTAGLESTIQTQAALMNHRVRPVQQESTTQIQALSPLMHARAVWRESI